MAFGIAGSSQAKRGEVAAVLDIGSSKIVCFIGCFDPDVGVRLMGIGHHASQGIKCGAVVDMDSAELSIRCAVEKAERAAGFTISSVSVNVAVRSLSSQHLTVETGFSSGDVAERDLKRVISTALGEFSEPEDAILHALPLNWSVDDTRGIRDPRGMFGKRLGVDMHFVTASVGPLRNLAHCVERCHLRINNIIASPYAAGLGALVDDELDLGATVIDMGAGVTSASVFRDRALVMVDAVPIGGHHVSADIARGLATNLKDAERIKSLYGSALSSPKDDYQMITCPAIVEHGQPHQESRALLTSIVQSRLEETFEILRDRLARAGVDEFAGRRIVLTGGAAQLCGAGELAGRIFGKRVRIGRPHGLLGLSEHAAGSDFATAAGLIKHVFTARAEAISGTPDLSGRKYRRRRYAGNPIERSLDWLKQNF
ncbi:cell division protein FtsA [Robiginitomaculum antarcticum]|uniref:cell division protein FtsA n=1 Tax=Robiginitomaculum antarcticum TaxID=437507 RepID=UPI00036B54FB|nr:cell division protein FtsA [Robiginitomaculum antarcticum]